MRNVLIATAVLMIGLASSVHAESALSREWPVSPMQANRPGLINASLGAPIAPEGSGAIPALPLEVQHQGDIAYINGGVSDEEEAQLKSTGSQYNLHLLVSAVTGAYIGDTNVRVIDAKGNEVLSVNNAGPYLYAKLPAGRYTIQATDTATGNTKKVAANIPANGSTKSHLAFNE